MDDRITREAKLNATKDIIANYVKVANEHHQPLSPDQVCEFFSKLYRTIDETVPDPEKRRVGLG
jgi:hypothetical protein